MNPFEFIKSLEHHAYFIHSFENSIHKLKEHLKEKLGISHAQNPDFFHESYETFTIDESRRIKELHAGRSFVEGNKKIFIIEAKGMTHEAQNSLLKIFEEPHEHTHFFLVMPNEQILLPTLRSRLYITKVDVEDAQDKNVIVEVNKFIKMSLKEKIEYMDELAKKISDEKLQKSDAIEFLAALEVMLYKKVDIQKISEQQIKVFNSIAKARDYMNDRSPSVKQLLEFVALSFS